MKILCRVLVVLLAFVVIPLTGCNSSDGTSTAPEGAGMDSAANPSAIQNAAEIKDEAPKAAAEPAK